MDSKGRLEWSAILELTMAPLERWVYSKLQGSNTLTAESYELQPRPLGTLSCVRSLYRVCDLSIVATVWPNLTLFLLHLLLFFNIPDAPTFSLNECDWKHKICYQTNLQFCMPDYLFFGLLIFSKHKYILWFSFTTNNMCKNILNNH